MADLAEQHDAAIVVDEAHANGVLGPAGRGGVFAAGLQDRVLARVVTFGKALGLQGGAVLCSKDLRDYLVNFARSFVFSTGVSPLWAASVQAVYEMLPDLNAERGRLLDNVSRFRERAAESAQPWLPSESWIQCLRVPGARRITRVGGVLRSRGLAALPIRAPTVPEGRGANPGVSALVQHQGGNRLPVQRRGRSAALEPGGGRQVDIIFRPQPLPVMPHEKPDGRCNTRPFRRGSCRRGADCQSGGQACRPPTGPCPAPTGKPMPLRTCSRKARWCLPGFPRPLRRAARPSVSPWRKTGT